LQKAQANEWEVLKWLLWDLSVMLIPFQDKTIKAHWQVFGKAARQCGIIFVIAVSLGLCINQFRDNRLPLFADRSTEASLAVPSGERLDISLIEAKKLFFRKAAVFIDARPKEDFEKGHIKGAKSLPWHDVDQKFMSVTENLSLDTPIIAYCDGEACELSRHLAIFLIDAGFRHVRVLRNGWTEWRNAHLPSGTNDDR
jgi:rhodanese-related sulfurtransferase